MAMKQFPDRAVLSVAILLVVCGTCTRSGRHLVLGWPDERRHFCRNDSASVGAGESAGGIPESIGGVSGPRESQEV